MKETKNVPDAAASFRALFSNPTHTSILPSLPLPPLHLPLLHLPLPLLHLHLHRRWRRVSRGVVDGVAKIGRLPLLLPLLPVAVRRDLRRRGVPLVRGVP